MEDRFAGYQEFDDRVSSLSQNTKTAIRGSAESGAIGDVARSGAGLPASLLLGIIHRRGRLQQLLNQPKQDWYSDLTAGDGSTRSRSVITRLIRVPILVVPG